jgi:hypothetical protein
MIVLTMARILHICKKNGVAQYSLPPFQVGRFEVKFTYHEIFFHR